MLNSYPTITPITDIYSALETNNIDWAVEQILHAPINICTTLEDEHILSNIINIFEAKLIPIVERILAARNGDLPFIGASENDRDGHIKGGLAENRILVDNFSRVLNAVITRFPDANSPSTLQLHLLSGQPELQGIATKFFHSLHDDKSASSRPLKM
jgi:hypothetical protein